MKTKPTKHKEENTFKFQTFAERLSSINVDIIHQVRAPRNLTPEETDTFFWEALQKWQDLNLTEGFTSFCRTVGKDVENLAQVLLNKEKLIALLKEHLGKKESLYLQPLLELLVALARDLQTDFYPYFGEFFKIIVSLLGSKNAEQLEWAFTTLAYLYKFLWRYLVKDIKTTYGLQRPLLSGHQPEHVRRFAAESFAFLGRKVVDKRSFLNRVWKELERYPEDAEGVGRLLFEIVKGVPHQFHSCSEVIVGLLLQSLHQNSEPVAEAISEAFLCMARHTTNVYAKPIWNLLLNEIGDSLTGSKAAVLPHFLRLLGMWVQYQGGSLVDHPNAVAQTIISLLQSPTDVINAQSQEILVQLLVTFFGATHVKLPLELSSRIIRLIFQSAALPLEHVFTLVEQLHNQVLFESHILPMYMQFVHGTMSAEDSSKLASLRSVATLLISKRPLPQSGEDAPSWKSYPLEFTFAMKKAPSKFSFPKYVQDLLTSSKLEIRWEIVLFALVCALHIKPLDVEQVLSSTRDIFLKSIKLAQQNPSNQVPMASVTNVALLVLATLAPENESSLSEYVKLEDLLPEKAQSVGLLKVPAFVRSLDIFLTSIKKTEPGLLSTDLLQRCYRLLVANVSSPHHKLKWLTLHIFSLFEPPLPPPPPRPGMEEEVEIKNVFQLAFEAESVSIGLSEYREKLRRMQLMEHGLVQLSLPVDQPEYHTLPLRYFLGVLYQNFKPMWEPTMKLIESFASNISAEDFWPIFYPYLLEVTEKAKQESDSRNKTKTEEWSCDSESAREIVEGLGSGKERLDHTMVRYLLWQTLSRFPNFAEKNSTVIVPLFLTFWKTEFRTSDATVTPTQNLTPEGGARTEDDDEKSTKPKKYVGKTLCAQLAVFAKFQKPGKMHQESEMYPLFVDLLAHRAPDIQKAALDCVLAYKNKHLTPYKENLNRILDDRTFKYELTLFHIDSEANVVRPEHRQTLMDILTRILFGKMQSKTGPKSGGKSNSGYRQGLVLRFISGCTPPEMQMFLDMAFHLFKPFLKDSLNKSVENVMQNADPAHALPLKRLQGALNLMGLFFAKVGHLLQSALSYLRHILLVILAQVNAFLGKLRDTVAPRYLNLLKTLRQLAYTRLIQFTTKFHNYPWNADEVEALFASAVWPQLPLLTTEAIQSPTALLKLCNAWAQNPRMFVFFAKHHPGDPSVSVLPVLLEVLTGGKAQGPVSKLILHILENLVTLADYTEETVKTSYTAKKPHRKAIDGLEDDEDALEEDEDQEDVHMEFNPIMCNSILPITADGLTRFKERPNFGSLLLRPHVMSILGHLEVSVKRAAKRSSGLGSRELILLARLTEFVEGEEESGRLAILVCQALEAGLGAKRTASDEEDTEEGDSSTRKRVKKGKKMNEESVVYLLETLGHLLHVADEPKKYIKFLSPLFGVVGNRTSRGSLLDVLAVIGKRDRELKELADFGSDLNAFDVRRVEEPDYNRRLKAYKFINEKLQSMEISKDLCLFVIYNVVYQLKIEEDMSLRDCASACLQNFASFLQKKSEANLELAQIVLQLLFAQVRLLLRSKKENVRHEALAILTQLVVRCHHLHPQLKDLLKLRTEDDLEADFYENIRHLQTHRRARAMSRLAAKLLADPNGKFLQADTLTQVLLPVVSCVFFSEHYAKYSHMVDAAIEALGAIARCLPWYSYDRLLRYFLVSLSKQPEFQKQAVRTAVAVLDAFHFDLSSSKLNVKEIKEEVKEEDIKEDETNENVTEAEDESQELDLAIEHGVPEEPEPVPKGTAPGQLSANTATKIHEAIVRHLLPHLNRLLTARSAREEKHKSNRGSEHFAEDEEILRVPLALAMVSLLKNLPKGTLERNLQGIFFKVSTFLKSKADSVRQTARETLIRIMQNLSPVYLGKLLHAMKGILQRGYQIHVLIFTIHAILRALEAQIEPGSIDNIIPSLVEICKQELFGQAAEEKEVTKVKEAKSVKSYDTLNLLAAKTGPGVLVPLVSPFQEVLAATRSHQTVNKVQEALQHMATGLAANPALPVPALLTFFYGVVSQSIPQLYPPEKQSKKDPKVAKPDSFLIAPEPKRFTPAAGSIAARRSGQANAHVIVEFGWHCLQMILKKDRIQVEDTAHLSMTDPFVPLLTDSLNSPYPKITTLALRCLTKIMRWNLPSVKTHVKTWAEFLFVTLNKYAGTTGQGEIADMVHAAFKAVTMLVRDIPSYSLTEEQLRVLLTYAETGLADPQRQTLGFGVFRAILNRKLTAPELPHCMERLAKLSITSEADHVRLQARQVVLQYFLDYPLGPKLMKHVEFYLAQLHYEHESGRLSTIDMLQTVVSSFPKRIVNERSSLFFVHLAPVIINDTSAVCSKNAAQVIKALILKVDAKQANEMFDLVLAWLQDTKWAHKRLAAQLAGLFVEVEAAKFQSRLASILAPLSKVLDPDNVCEDTHTSDHVAIQALTLLLKICQNCSPAIHGTEYGSAMTTIWGYVQEHLMHPHAWVRLLAARSIGLLFSFHNPESLAKKANEVLSRDVSPKKKKQKSSADERDNDKPEKSFLVNEEISEKLRSLAADCLAQLQSQLLDEQLAEQIIKNLVYLAKVAARMPSATSDSAAKHESEKEDEEAPEDNAPHQVPGPPTIRWLIRRLRGEINQEVAVNPKHSIKRTSAFKWIAAVAMDLAQLHGSDVVLLYLSHMLPPLARELGDDGAPEPVRELAQEVADLIKGLVGQEVFATQLLSAQRTLYKRRGERKMQRAARAVTNPALAAKLKMKKQTTKKEAKKRKMASLRGKKLKKPKLKDLAFAED